MTNALAIASVVGKVWLAVGTTILAGLAGGSRFLVPSGVTIEGVGPGQTNIKLKSGALSPAGQALFQFAGSGQQLIGVTIDGNGHTTDIQTLIYGNAAAQLKIRDVRLHNAAPQLAAVYLSLCTRLDISGLDIDAFVGTVSAQTRCSALVVTQTTRGVTLNRICRVRVLGGLAGVSLVNQQSFHLSDLIITDQAGATAASGVGLQLDNCADGTGGDFRIDGRRDSGIVILTQTADQVPENLTFANIVANANTLDGIYIGAGRNMVLQGVVCNNNNQRNSGAGNRFGVNINIESGEVTQDIIISGLRATDNQGVKTQVYGVAVASGVENVSIVPASLDGNLTGPFSDAGTNTMIMDVRGHYAFLLDAGLRNLTRSGVADSGGTGFKQARFPN